MSNEGFFSDYQNKENNFKKIFESIEKKIKPVNKIDEAFFGLIKNDQEREKSLKNTFFQFLQSPSWQNYKITTSKGDVILRDSDLEMKNDAWEIIKSKAKCDGFRGAIKQDGDSVIYQAKDPNKKCNDNVDDKEEEKEEKEEVEDSEQSKEADSQEDGQEETEDENPIYEILKSKNGGFDFGGPRRNAKKIENTQYEIDGYNWEQGRLKYMFDPKLKFNVESIAFDFDKGIISSVRGGVWIGNFEGDLFESTFDGKYFKGNFLGDNSNFKSHPTSFISGTFDDTSDSGVLGLNDVKEGNENYSFNLIQIPEKYSIEILTDKQLRHTITTVKRIDNVSSDFSYNVYMGYEIGSSEPKIITLTWEQIRSSFENYRVSSNLKVLPGVFELDSDEKVLELRIVKAGTPPVFTKKEKFENNKQYSEDLNSLFGLKNLSKTKYNYKFNFNITNNDDFENFNKIKGYINSKQFINDLSNISIMLDNKIISQSDINSYPYLRNVFTSEVLSEVTLFRSQERSGNPGDELDDNSSLYNKYNKTYIKTEADIINYLNAKYSESIKNNNGKKPPKYNIDYNELKKILLNKKTDKVNNLQFASNNEDLSSMRRLENFIKFFVYKIESGDNTNKIRKYFIDLIKNNITKHKQQPIKQKAPTAQAPTAQAPTAQAPTAQAPTAQNPSITPVKPKKIKESYLRDNIRKMINDMLK